MAVRKEYTQDVFDNYGRLRRNLSLNQADIGIQMKQLYPAFFDTLRPASICKAIVQQAQDRSIDIPLAKAGGKPRMIPESDSRWRDQNPELIFPFSSKVIVASDIHFPLHLKMYLVRFIQVCKARKMETVVINGDVFDNGHKGHKGYRSVWAPSNDDCVDSFRYFMVGLLAACPSIQRIVAICGNHDDKVFRASDQEILFREYFNRAMTGIETGDIEVLVTNRYYAIMRPMAPSPWPFTGPENFASLFAHQMEYSRIPGRVENRLTNVELMNTYAGHHHHLSISEHESDMFHNVGCGTGQDPTLASYKNVRPSTHPKWCVGFVTIEHNVPKRWRIFDPDTWWDAELGEEPEE